MVQWACDFPAGVLRGSSATLTTSLSWCVPGSDRGGRRGNTHQLKFSSPKELPVLIGLLTVLVCVCVCAHVLPAQKLAGLCPPMASFQALASKISFSETVIFKCMWKRGQKK